MLAARHFRERPRAIKSASSDKREAAASAGPLIALPAGWRLRFLLTAMRPHQWLKNVLIFPALLLSLPTATPYTALQFLLAFVAMSLLASGTYLINDIADLNADRVHPTKRNRPLAAGNLPVQSAALAAFVLCSAGLAIGFWIGMRCGLAIVGYLALTLAYTYLLKRYALLDVLVIALLFTIRILVGMMIISPDLSYWLLNFSVFLFTSLALMKRDAELVNMRGRDQDKSPGRGYAALDREFVFTAGMATAVASQVIFALFVATLIENGRHYSSPFFLWTAQFFLGYWLLRLWLLAHRGQMLEDPIVFTMRDRLSLVAILSVGLLTALAQLV